MNPATTKDKVHVVLLEDFELAYDRWCDFYGMDPGLAGPVTSPAFNEFAFLDDPCWRVIRFNKVVVCLSERSNKRINLLLSTHWRALLKAYEAIKPSMEVSQIKTI